MRSKLDVVVGLQFGSESKGRVTAAIVERRRTQGYRTVGVRVAGPNAGHVVIDRAGREWKLRQVPVGMVADPLCTGVIAAGSEIDPVVLFDEVEALETAGHRVRERLLIDGTATIIEPTDREAEGEMIGRIGSTGKGVGAARARRVMRNAGTVGGMCGWAAGGRIVDTVAYLRDELRTETAVVIEGTQGYGLGLHAGYYPQCTSSDCRAIDFLAMAGISPWQDGGRGGVDLQVHGVARVYPIRVAGPSGPLVGETSWEQLGLPEERTTVTNKVRRVGAWDPGLVRRAVLASGGSAVQVHLAMVDQKLPWLGGIQNWSDLAVESGGGRWDQLSELVGKVQRDCGANVVSLGTGPASTVWMPPLPRRLGGLIEIDELIEIVDDRAEVNVGDHVVRGEN